MSYTITRESTGKVLVESTNLLPNYLPSDALVKQTPDGVDILNSNFEKISAFDATTVTQIDDGTTQTTPTTPTELFNAMKTVFRNGGSTPLSTEQLADLAFTGFADYNDLATTATPLNITVAGNPTLLTNDGVGGFTNKTYLPNGVTDVWDSTLNTFDWSELKLGDRVDIRLDIDLITTSVNTEINVDLYFGTGVGAYKIPFISGADFKNTGTHKLNRFNSIYMGDTNTLNNGGQFKITTDKDCTVVVNGWYCSVIKKGI